MSHTPAGTAEVPEAAAGGGRRSRAEFWAGGGAVVAIAALLFTRYPIGGAFSRDSGVYVYGGQQLAHHGVAPYASIFDPKGPLVEMLCALGIALGNLFGLHDLTGARVLFFLLSVATVAAVYLLARRLFGSVLLGVTAGVVMASFTGFAANALTGPEAKTPGLLCVVLATWLALDRRWVWVGVFSGLCFLDWQPFFTYAVVFGLCALLLPDGDERLHWRSLARFAVGAAAPLVATLLYFVADGTVGAMWQAAFVFPLTGIRRASETFLEHLQLIRSTVTGESGFGPSGPLLSVGLLLLLLATVVAFVRATRDGGSRWAAGFADPLVSLVFVAGLLQILYMLYDFQGYPDLFPALPYGALGIAAGAALVRDVLPAAQRVRLAAGAVTVALILALAGAAWSWFLDDSRSADDLRLELADACAVQRAASGQGGLWSLGYPPVLVLTGRTNPEPYIYLLSGVQDWKVAHTRGGLNGWAYQIAARHPGVIVLAGWAGTYKGSYRYPLVDRLVAAGYERAHFGEWAVLLTPAARAQAVARGVQPTRVLTRVAVGTDGRMLPGYPCLPGGK